MFRRPFAQEEPDGNVSGFAMVERLVLYESCIGDECDLER